MVLNKISRMAYMTLALYSCLRNWLKQLVQVISQISEIYRALMAYTT